MAGRTVEVVVGRPAEEVFAYMDDVTRELEWQPGLLLAEQSPAGPTSVGTRRRYVSEFMGRRIENVYVVTDFDPPRSIRLRTTEESSLDVVSEVAWQPIAGGTRVRMSIEGVPRGSLRFLPRRVLEAAFEREISAALERLKSRLESEP